MSIPSNSLLTGFFQSVDRYPDRPALQVGSEVLSYEELDRHARALAEFLDHESGDEPVPLTAVFAYRTVASYVGVLAALMRGHGYVPLNRTFPEDRSSPMLARSGCRSVVVDGLSSTQLAKVLDGLEPTTVIIIDDEGGTSDGTDRRTLSGHKNVRRNTKTIDTGWRPRPAGDQAIAYLLFTSGSTGIPKGVGVTHANVGTFLAAVDDRYDFSPHDRFS